MSRAITHYYLNIPFFTDEFLNSLKPLAIDAHEKKNYQWNPPGGIGLTYLAGNLSNSVLNKFIDDLMIHQKKAPVFSITSSNTWLHKHSDKFGINSKIVIPLLPMENFQPWPCYHQDGSVELIEMIPHRPVLVDTDILHGGFTTINDRMSLQFTFNLTIHEIKNLIELKKFTKTIECTLLE